MEFLTSAEVAQMLRLPVTQVRRWGLQGKLPAIVLPDREVRFDAEELRSHFMIISSDDRNWARHSQVLSKLGFIGHPTDADPLRECSKFAAGALYAILADDREHSRDQILRDLARLFGGNPFAAIAAGNVQLGRCDFWDALNLLQEYLRPCGFYVQPTPRAGRHFFKIVEIERLD